MYEHVGTSAKQQTDKKHLCAGGYGTDHCGTSDLQHYCEKYHVAYPETSVIL